MVLKLKKIITVYAVISLLVLGIVGVSAAPTYAHDKSSGFSFISFKGFFNSNWWDLWMGSSNFAVSDKFKSKAFKKFFKKKRNDNDDSSSNDPDGGIGGDD